MSSGGGVGWHAKNLLINDFASKRALGSAGKLLTTVPLKQALRGFAEGSFRHPATRELESAPKSAGANLSITEPVKLSSS